MIYTKTNIFFLLTLLSFLFACEEKSEIVEEEIEEQEAVAAFMFTKIEKWYSEDANLKIKMRSPLELIYQKGNVISEIVYPSGIKVSMYDEFGIRTTTLTADSGRHIVATEVFSAIGNVEVVNYKEKQRVNTSILNWNKRTKEIYTDQKIKITTPYETLEGVGMTSNEQFSQYKVWQPTGTFLVKDGDQAVPSDTSAVARQRRSVLDLRKNKNNPKTKNRNLLDPRLRNQQKNSRIASEIISGAKFNMDSLRKLKGKRSSGEFKKNPNTNLDSLRRVRRERIKKLKQTDKKKSPKDKK